MFSFTSMPSTTSVLSTYSSFAASAMLLRTVISEVQTMTTQLIPQQLREKLFSKLGGLFGYNFSSQITLIIDEHNGLSINEIYQASDIYLSTIITPSVKHLKVSKAPREKNLSITIDKGEKIIDEFEGIRLIWEFISTDHETSLPSTETSKQRSIHLSFHKKYKEIVLSTYLPYVEDRSKAIKEENKVVKLYSLGNSYQDVNLDHPSTFDTLAMDPKLKKELMDDLDRFLKRREFYRRVGKAWKRGYLLYGPPGTGKSSLIAAMANYLKFDIYDLELSNLRSNADLRGLMASTANRSILVIEDIDCTTELQDRQYGGYNEGDNQVSS